MKTRLFSFLLAALLLAGCKNDDFNNPEPSATTKGTATIAAGTVQQNIRGFGGASIRGWIADLTSAQITKAFSTSSGIGLSVLRVRVPYNSSDFAAEKPTIQAAKNLGATVIASAWTAPPSMKTNNNAIGGKINTSSYAAYAAHLSSYCSAVGGVSAISVTNEPNISVTYESMSMTASDVANFVAAQGSACGAPIMGPEPFNMDQSFINTYLSNATAKSKTSYVCGHIYGVTPSVFSPGKEIWMTEHYTDSNDANGWSGALNVGKEIHNCMNAGYSMYVWWYIRRSYGLLDESSNVTKRGYVMAQWAKFVRPGYSKISCTSNPTSGVFVTAYKSGSKIVIVAVNTNSSSTFQQFSLTGASVTGFTRYVTSSSQNLASDSFSASASFGVTLAASSVTTLVSN